jgi:hypothetical protein
MFRILFIGVFGTVLVIGLLTAILNSPEQQKRAQESPSVYRRVMTKLGFNRQDSASAHMRKFSSKVEGDVVRLRERMEDVHERGLKIKDQLSAQKIVLNLQRENIRVIDEVLGSIDFDQNQRIEDKTAELMAYQESLSTRSGLFEQQLRSSGFLLGKEQEDDIKLRELNEQVQSLVDDQQRFMDQIADVNENTKEQAVATRQRIEDALQKIEQVPGPDQTLAKERLREVMERQDEVSVKLADNKQRLEEIRLRARTQLAEARERANEQRLLQKERIADQLQRNKDAIRDQRERNESR